MLDKEYEQKMHKIFTYFAEKARLDEITKEFEGNGSTKFGISYLVLPTDHWELGTNNESGVGVHIGYRIGLDMEPDAQVFELKVGQKIPTIDQDRKGLFEYMEVQKPLGILEARVYTDYKELHFWDGKSVFSANFAGDKIVSAHGNEDIELARKYESRIKALVNGTDARVAVDLAFEIYDTKN